MATGNSRFINLLKAASLATLLGTTAAMAGIPSPGDPRGIEFQVNTTTQFSQSNPSVASDAAGDSVVVWTGFTLGSDGGLHDGVVAQLYAPDGQRVGVEFQVNNFSLRFNDSKLQPRVAMDAAGDFVVTWYEQHVDNPADFFNSPQEYNIFAKLYDKTGTALGP